MLTKVCSVIGRAAEHTAAIEAASLAEPLREIQVRSSFSAIAKSSGVSTLTPA